MIILTIVSWLQFVLIWMYILLPLVELFINMDAPEKPFPYKMRFPYDANRNVPYGFTYFLTSLAGFGVVTTLFSEDSLFAFFTSHTCAQLQLLQQHIDDMIRTAQINAVKRYPDSNRAQRMLDIQHEYRQLFAQYIRHHNRVIG